MERPKEHGSRSIEPRLGCGRMSTKKGKGNSSALVYKWFRLLSEILGDDYLTRKWCTSLHHCWRVSKEEDIPIEANLPDKHSCRVRRRKKQIGREFYLDAQVDGYDIKDVILYLGLDVKKPF